MSRSKVCCFLLMFVQWDATVVLVDAGPSMNELLRERSAVQLKKAVGEQTPNTRFDAAMTTVQNLLQQKMFFKPKDDVGIVLYGTPETDNQLNEEQGEYENVRVVADIAPPTLALCKRLKQLQATAIEQRDEVKVDLLDGLIVALDLLFRHTDKKKYEKKLLVITDASEKIHDASDVESIVTMMHQMEVKLQIVGMDFSVINEDQVKKEPADESTSLTPAQNIKVENEKMLVSIATEVSGSISSVSKRMDVIAQGTKRVVAQVTKFRGNLEIGKSLGIPLYCYVKTKTATLPRMLKESQASYDKDTLGKVKMDRLFHSPSNPDEQVAPERRIKAYRYGQDKVPFSSADLESFKLQTEKSLKLLGFVDNSQLNHAKFIGATDVFVAEPEKPKAAEALAALVKAMESLEKIAIARFVARKNAAPKIMALIPHSPTPQDDYFCLWGQQLPFEEDLRNYEFRPLQIPKSQPTSEQQALADRLVDSLTVKTEKSAEVISCFNPVLIRFFNAVQLRAFDANAPIPPLPSYVDSALNLDELRAMKIKDLVEDFEKSFGLKEAVLKAKDRKRKTFWSDTATPADDPVKKEEADENGGGDIVAGGNSDDELDLEDLLDGETVTSVGSMNPISDFEALLDTRKPSNARTATSGMETQIMNFFEHGKDFYPKALQCLTHFRRRTPDIHYSLSFNEFMTKIKSQYEDTKPVIWDKLKRLNLTILSEEEDSSLSVTKAQAQVFLFGEPEEDEQSTQAAADSLSSQIEQLEQEDDMFAEFE